MNRLNAIVNFVPPGSRVADIAADHAFLAIELAKSRRAEFVIATDKNPAPLACAQKNIAAANLPIQTRLGDGLQPIKPGEVDTLCIAGIGGALICTILDNPVTDTVSNLILQPMNAIDKVYSFLRGKFFIADVDLAEDNNFIYEIIFATRDFNNISPHKKIDSSPLRGKYFQQKAAKLQRIIAEMSKSPVAVNTAKFHQLKIQLEKYAYAL